MKGKRVLIDTSAWIDFFKGRNSSLSKQIDFILDNAYVFVPKAVIAELIQGAKSEREIKVIEEFLTVFNIIDSMPDTWIKAGKLSFNLKKKGLTLNLMDCYIAVLAMEYGCSILTLDKHFKDIRKLTGIDLV